MAEGSGFWDGTITGDAAGSIWAAPYSYFDYAEILSLAFLSEDGLAHVIPGYLNELNAEALVEDLMAVSIDSGAAFVRGQLYINDEIVTLSIDAADATNPRIDRIVLETVYADQTIRLAVVKGTAAASPALPSLTQDNTTYQTEIARVYVKPASIEIEDYYVEDCRTFLASSYEHNNFERKNLLANSELMLPPIMDGSGWIGLANVSTPPAFPSALVTRGHVIPVGGSSTAVMYQTIPCKPDTLYTLKFLYQNTGSTYYPSVKISTDTDTTGITKYFPKVNGTYTSNWETKIVRFTTDSSATTLTVTYGSGTLTGAAGSGKISQSLLCEGYWTGPFREVSEFIPLRLATTKAFAVVPGSTTAIDLSGITLSPYNYAVTTGIRGVELQVALRGGGTSNPATGSLGVRPQNVASGNNMYVTYGTVLTSQTNYEVGFCGVVGTSLYIVPTSIAAATQYEMQLLGIIT